MKITTKLQDEIFKAISEIGNRGATIQQIEKKVGLERHTLSKYLFMLVKYGLINYYSVGKAKIWFINKAPMQTIFTTEPDKMTFAERVLIEILSNTPEGIIVIDQHFSMQFMNNKMSDKYGDLTGKFFYSDILGMENPMKLKQLSDMIDNGTKSAQFEITDKDSRLLAIKASKLINPDRTISLILIVEDVTEKKKAEDDLLHSEQRFSLFMENLPGLAWIKDINGRYVYANEASEKAFRVSKDELYGKKDDDIFPPETASAFKSNDKRALDDKKGIQTIEKLKHEDGIVHYSNVTKFPILDNKGNITMIGGTAFDITDRLKAERALKESEIKFRKMFEQSPLSIQIFSPDGRCIDVNRKWEEMWGSKREDVLTYNVLKDRQLEEIGAMSIIKKAFSGEFVQVPPTFYDPKKNNITGKAVWTEGVMYPVENEDGTIREIVLVHNDITEKVEAQKLYQESQETYRKLVETSPDAILVVDLKTNIDFVNKRTLEIFGYESEQELIGKNGIELLIDPDDIEKAFSSLQNVITTGGIKLIELKMIKKDGSKFPTEVSAALLSDKGGKPEKLIGIVRDITEKSQALSLLNESQENYMDLFSNAPLGYHVAGKDKIILDVNKAEMEILGYSKEDILGGKTFGDFIIPEERHLFEEQWEKMKREGASDEMDFAIRRKDGEHVFIRWRATGKFDLRGKLAEARVTVKDVTERVKYKKEIIERIKQQENIAQLGLRAMAITDFQKFIEIAASNVCDILGVEFCKLSRYLPEENSLQLVAGAGFKEELINMAKSKIDDKSLSGFTLKSKEPVIVHDFASETRFKGSDFDFENKIISGISVIVIGRDAPFGVISALSTREINFTRDDINYLQSVSNIIAAAAEKERTLDELKKSESELSVILNGVKDGITVQDVKGNLIYANQAAARITGFETVEELKSTPPEGITARFEMRDEKGLPFPIENLPGRIAMEGKESPAAIINFKIKKTSEERWSLLKASPVLDKKGKVLMVVNIFHDITELKNKNQLQQGNP